MDALARCLGTALARHRRDALPELPGEPPWGASGGGRQGAGLAQCGMGTFLAAPRLGRSAGLLPAISSPECGAAWPLSELRLVSGSRSRRPPEPPRSTALWVEGHPADSQFDLAQQAEAWARPPRVRGARRRAARMRLEWARAGRTFRVEGPMVCSSLPREGERPPRVSISRLPRAMAPERADAKLELPCAGHLL